ncbi:MAG TPA: uridine kinase [Microbacteriaceae bacterium]|nr:uridine kinase [Microbacteriaceae bacterium]
MELTTTPRVELWHALTDEITHNYSRGRIFLAVDGILGSGTAAFADGLADALRERGHETVRASLTDFAAPREARERQGADSGHGFYDDEYDEAAFRRLLVEPFSLAGRPFHTASYDRAAERSLETAPQTAGDDAFCIVDGVFLNRPELHGIWHYSLYLEVPWAVAYARLQAAGQAPSADPDDPANRRTRKGQDRYLAEVFPRGVANAIIDNTDDNRPLRVFADSC